MDTDRIKKIFPFLKNVDLDDPGTRKNIMLGSLAAALLLLVLIISVARGGKRSSGEPVSVTPSVLLDEPEGEDRDILDKSNPMDVYADAERQGKRNFGEEIFSSAHSDGALLSESDLQPSGEDTSSSVASGLKDRFGFTDEGITDAEREREERRMRRERHRDSLRHLSEEAAAAAARSSSPHEGLSDAEISRRQLAAAGYNPDTGEYVGQEAARRALSEELPDSGTPDQVEEQDKNRLAPRAIIRQPGGVSSLDDQWSGSGGVESLDGSAARLSENTAHPFEVMFAKSEKLSSGGRITLRLLEDMVVDGVKIPKNAPLSGVCSISDRRLDIKVNAMKIGDRIYTLDLTAYDTDGLPGLYCPQTNANRTLKQGTSEAGQIVRSALQSGIAGYAGQVVSAGASMVQSASGNITISVSAGYKFYLIRDEH